MRIFKLVKKTNRGVFQKLIFERNKMQVNQASYPTTALPLNTPETVLHNLEPEFDHRDQRGLTKLTENQTKLWISQQITFNHLLKPNAMFLKSRAFSYDMREFVLLGQATKAQWLTDYSALTTAAATKVNLAALLCVYYTVLPSEVDKIVQELFSQLSNSEISDLEYCVGKLTAHLFLDKESEIDATVEKYINRTFPKVTIQEKDELRQKVRLREHLQIIKQTQHEVICRRLEGKLHELCLEHGLSRKPLHTPSTPHRLILGAVASGKSTTIQNLNLNMRECVHYSTDNFRTVMISEELPSTNDQYYLQTQDKAYLIGERVRFFLEREKQKGTLPTLILDILTLDSWVEKLLPQNETVEVLSVCLCDASQIANRAHARAQSEQATAENKGRYVNTHDLLDSHRKMSMNMLKSLPTHCPNVKFIDTSGRIPVKFVEVKKISDNPIQIRVYDFDRFIQYLQKKHINSHAVSRATLFTSPSLDSSLTLFEFLRDYSEYTPQIEIMVNQNGEELLAARVTLNKDMKSMCIEMFTPENSNIKLNNIRKLIEGALPLSP